MTREQMKAVRERLERADEIVKELDALNEADPYKAGRKCSFTEWNTGEAVLSDEVLKRVVATGRLARIKELEVELRAMPVLTTEPLPADVHTP